jgi:hypothetical protein
VILQIYVIKQTAKKNYQPSEYDSKRRNNKELDRDKNKSYYLIELTPNLAAPIAPTS